MKILSRKDIEKIAERVLKAYKNLPENINTDITHIDPELLLTNLLGFIKERKILWRLHSPKDYYSRLHIQNPKSQRGRSTNVYGTE